jgi:endonuclease G, mitochondrial
VTTSPLNSVLIREALRRYNLVAADSASESPTAFLPEGGPEGAGPAAWEAIVRRFERPALLVRRGSFEVPESDTWHARLSANRSKLERALASVGRVELANFRQPWIGTAWMIAPNIAVTNRHVAELFTTRDDGRLAIGHGLDGGPIEVFVNFGAEHLEPARPGQRLRVTRVLHVAAKWPSEPDLELEPGAPPPIPLRSAGAAADEVVAVIGYPARDPRNDAADMTRIFGEVFEVKRLSPGLVLYGAGDGPEFTHDATSLGGNSGSVVLDVESGMAVGLHFGGRYLRANHAVTAATLRAHLAALSSEAPPHVEVPVRTLDGLAEAAPAGLEDRRGYDPDFLGEGARSVPLPGLDAVAADVAARLDDPSQCVLHYTNFSLVMNRTRRLAFFTATNIDGTTAQAIKRKGPETWYYDPRIDRAHQVGNALYANNELDRGHLTRRLDPAWGPAARAAERDTFFWTNCSPQHADFNQRLWLGLEDYILENARSEGLRATIFTGPVFRADDPEYRGVQLPRSFWKVAVVVTSDGALSATGYLLGQASLLGDLEFVYGAYGTYQVSVGAIAASTRLGFGALVEHDPLAVESPVARPLARPGDIVL